ncbi:MAG: GNAT family protein [Planctomycetota bacterium]
MIRGNKIVLRDWEPADVPVYRKHMQPGAPWQLLDGPDYPRPTGPAAEQHIEQITAKIAKAQWPTPRMVFAVADAERQRFLGKVSRYWQSEETAWLSLGVVIYDNEQWGKGFGYEALGLWSEYIFTEMPQLVRLDLRTWSGNPGMMRLAEKLGYVQEARFRDARIVAGKHYDGLGYGILRSEWSTRYPDGFASTLATD